jgi:hypothetical protein
MEVPARLSLVVFRAKLCNRGAVLGFRHQHSHSTGKHSPTRQSSTSLGSLAVHASADPAHPRTHHGGVAVLGDAEGSPAGARGVVHHYGGSLPAQALAPAHAEARPVRRPHRLPGTKSPHHLHSHPRSILLSKHRVPCADTVTCLISQHSFNSFLC